MQIFIKTLHGQTKTINNVNSGTTIKEVKIKLIYKTGKPPESFRLSYNKILEDEKTLGYYKITKEANLHEIPPEKKVEYDKQTKKILCKDLNSLNNKKCFLFIGLGSYDHGHGKSNDSIKRQQCPTSILLHCKKKKLPLIIILVDPEFNNDKVMNTPQIYNIDKNWFINKKINNNVWYYINKINKHRLMTYRTHIYDNEWTGKKLILAGVDLKKLAKSIFTKGGCFVSGNFYAKNSKPHLSMGFNFSTKMKEPEMKSLFSLQDDIEFELKIIKLTKNNKNKKCFIS